MSADSIGLEVATVSVFPEQRELLPEIFALLDEQVLDPELRRLLAPNGIRVGIIGSQVPESIQLLLMEATERSERPTAETQWVGDEQRYVQCRADKKSEIKLWPPHAEMTIEYDNGQFIVPEALNEGRCVMQFSGESKGQAGATIGLTPLVHHGPLRQHYVVEDNAFHFEAKQELREYDELFVGIDLRPGEILLMTCDDNEKPTIGRRFFLHESTQTQKLVLIRLAQTQFENLLETNSIGLGQ